jgi:hypothetical protein
MTKVLLITGDEYDGRTGQLNADDDSITVCCIACGEPLSELDGAGEREHLVCPGKLVLKAPVEWPEGTTIEQKRRVTVLARDFRATTINCWLDQFDLPDGWLYAVVHPMHGGDFHVGIAPDGASHS